MGAAVVTGGAVVTSGAAVDAMVTACAAVISDTAMGTVVTCVTGAVVVMLAFAGSVVCVVICGVVVVVCVVVCGAVVVVSEAVVVSVKAVVIFASCVSPPEPLPPEGELSDAAEQLESSSATRSAAANKGLLFRFISILAFQRMGKTPHRLPMRRFPHHHHIHDSILRQSYRFLFPR